jgi:hypothetical protein
MAASTPSRDWISRAALIGAPLYVVFRLITGGWTFVRFALIVIAAVAAFYVVFVLPGIDQNYPEEDDVSG